jgi:hypothetical protein
MATGEDLTLVAVVQFLKGDAKLPEKGHASEAVVYA